MTLMLKIHLSDNIMLKDKQQPVFEDKWPNMRPTILKLLRQARFVQKNTLRTDNLSKNRKL